MAANSTTSSKSMFTCPACDQEVHGTLSLTFNTGEVTGREVEIRAKVTGLRVQHDCVPKVLRGPA